MIIGIPNVGKPTLINKPARRSIVQTGNKPGVTKQQQWVKVGNTLQLLDTSGILRPKFEGGEVGKRLSLTGAIKDSIVHLSEVAIYGLNFLTQNGLTRLESRYNIEVPEDAEIIAWFDTIGRERGLIRRGSGIDYGAVIELVTYDIRNAKIGNCCFDISKDVTGELTNDANN